MKIASRLAALFVVLAPALIAQVPVPEKKAQVEDPPIIINQERLQLQSTAKGFTITEGTPGLDCLVLIGLHERHTILPGTGLRLEPLAILARGRFQYYGEFSYRWPAVDIDPLQFKIQAIGPIDAKGFVVSRVATYYYDGKKVREVRGDE